ncbi:MAG TPA: hypothetical protein PKZ06_01640 [Candidatus Pacearchaeota archaeon]|nr:hypothetical protein [Candidatus Pacearchaeota archaeon]HQI57781.1 hypothetical protein [Candidatus Pacearchaeota archaeon]
MKRLHNRFEKLRNDSIFSPLLEKLDRRNNHNVRHKKQDRGKKKRSAFQEKYPLE